MSDQYFFEKEWKFLLYRKTAYYLGLVMILMQGYLDKFKVSGRKSAKFVSGPFLYEKYLEFLFHIMIAFDLGACREPRVIVQVQGYC